MKVLGYKPALTDADKLAVACYLTLQDRIEEALDWFGRVDRAAVPEQLQSTTTSEPAWRCIAETSKGRGSWRKLTRRKV